MNEWKIEAQRTAAELAELRVAYDNLIGHIMRTGRAACQAFEAGKTDKAWERVEHLMHKASTYTK